MRLKEETLPHFAGDSRLDPSDRLDADDYATYLSAVSNRPDGG